MKRYLLSRLIWDVHPEHTATPECQELFINSDMGSRLVINLAIPDNLIPNFPDMGKPISFQTCRPCCWVIKTEGPDDEDEATLTEIGPVEGTPVDMRPHLLCSQMVVLADTTHEEDSKESLHLRQSCIPEGGLLCL